MKVYTFDNKVLTHDNKWLKEAAAPVPPGPSFQEVTIGTQTWTAEDLRIDDGQGGITVTQSGGYIYTPAAAARVANSISGWHLPSLSEFRTLASTVGSDNGTNLMLNGAWWGATTNSTGFNGVPQEDYSGDGYTGNIAFYMLVESSIPVEEESWYNYGYLQYDYDYDLERSLTEVGTGPNMYGRSQDTGFLRLIKDS
jgi:uncharacterized protein (TIGR02145 family)